MPESVGVVGRWLRRLIGPLPRASTAPLVVFDLDYANGRLFMVLTNTGTEPALDVSVAFDKPLPGLCGTKDFATLPLFSRLPVLRPGREVRLFFDAGPSIGAIGRFSAAVKWSLACGDARSATYVHDTAIYKHWPDAQ